METVMEMYGGKVYGVKVSDYGLERGRMDYGTLANILENVIQNNYIREETFGEWELITGESNEEVCSEYIISKYGYEFLRDNTDELVFYNERLDVYIWAVTHYGTRWDYVLTDIKLKEMN